jgi:hypothetical protein
MFELFVHVKSNLRNSLDFDDNAIFVTYLNIYLFILFFISSRPTSDTF